MKDIFLIILRLIFVFPDSLLIITISAAYAWALKIDGRDNYYMILIRVML